MIINCIINIVVVIIIINIIIITIHLFKDDKFATMLKNRLAFTTNFF